MIVPGTKKDEYHLEVSQLSDGGFSIEKKDANLDLKTRGENTIKLIRTIRCKNENIHAALKQKFKIFKEVVPLSFLEPLSADSSVSKYTAIAAVGCSLLNKEHPGFPVVFLKEHQKVPKARQLLLNFNNENFLQHIDVENMNWTEVALNDIHTKVDFPSLQPDNFEEIFEVTSSIHALQKGQGTGSNIRKREVNFSHPNDFEEYKEMIQVPPENIRVKFVRLNRPPADYLEKEREGILSAWPGAGTLVQMVCYPSNRSSNVRGNWKWPTIFVLDDPSANPLNCSNVFKSIGAFTCINCPSVNGNLGGCCHLGFTFMQLSAPWVLESTNRAVKLVNMKNPEFLHPAEVMSNTVSHAGFSTFSVRQSTDKRVNSALLHPEEVFSDDDESLNQVMEKRNGQILTIIHVKCLYRNMFRIKFSCKCIETLVYDHLSCFI